MRMIHLCLLLVVPRIVLQCLLNTKKIEMISEASAIGMHLGAGVDV